MEFGLREYLLILAAVLIVGMLADGIRRTLKHKREGLKLDLMAAPPESPERRDVGKPRPVKKATPEELEPHVSADPLFESFDANQLNLWAGEIKPEAMKSADTRALTGTMDLGTQKDSPSDGNEATLLPTETSDINSDEKLLGRIEPAWNESSDAEAETNFDESQPPLRKDNVTDHDADMRILADGPVTPPIEKVREGSLLGSTLGRIFKHLGARDSSRVKRPENFKIEQENAVSPTETTANLSVQTAPDAVMDDLILVGIKAGKLPRFEGVDLHKACLRAGLRRTEAQVYQRFPLDETDSPLFSLVNGVEPGTFECDANAIDTPMVFLFTELPKQTDPVFAVNEMISGARSIARDIGGAVFDQAGTPVSKEWIDFARAQASHQTLLRS
jgi:FtsZ-interacting cell division protein ZipA